MADDTIIAGLLAERAGYLARGLKDRAAQVDEQLKIRGYKEPEPAKAPEPESKASGADDQPDPVEPRRTAVESKPRRRA